jgi:hypothetical protein
MHNVLALKKYGILSIYQKSSITKKSGIIHHLAEELVYSVVPIFERESEH